MRTHGWAGSPPASDEEAVDRIVSVAYDVVVEHGRAPRMAEIARSLGVTRATVYRYFGDGEELLAALAARETEPFLVALGEHLAGETDAARAVVRAVQFVIDALPHRPAMALAFASDGGASRVVGVTAPPAQTFGREMLRAVGVDWAAAGFDEERFALLVEHMLRLIQSFLIDPGHPPRHGGALERYLAMWLEPAVRSVERSAGSAT